MTQLSVGAVWIDPDLSHTNDIFVHMCVYAHVHCMYMYMYMWFDNPIDVKMMLQHCNQ